MIKVLVSAMITTLTISAILSVSMFLVVYDTQQNREITSQVIYEYLHDNNMYKEDIEWIDLYHMSILYIKERTS